MWNLGIYIFIYINRESNSIFWFCHLNFSICYPLLLKPKFSLLNMFLTFIKSDIYLRWIGLRPSESYYIEELFPPILHEKKNWFLIYEFFIRCINLNNFFLISNTMEDICHIIYQKKYRILNALEWYFITNIS